MNALRWVKWLALACMTLDHIDAAWFGRSMWPLSGIGRLTMPLFAAVLAYNLARPGALDAGVYGRVIKRLLLFGALAYPWHVMALGQGWYTLNIMFAFAAGTAALWVIQRYPGRLWLFVMIIVGAGFWLEFHWAAPVLLVSLYVMFRGDGVTRFLLPAAAMVLLCWENGNLWALGAVPAMLALLLPQPMVPRRAWEGWLFYAYYPAHLALLVAVAPLVKGLVQ